MLKLFIQLSAALGPMPTSLFLQAPFTISTSGRHRCSWVPQTAGPPRLEPPPCPLRPPGALPAQPSPCSQRREGPVLTGLRAQPPTLPAQATGQPMALSSLDPACPHGVQTRRRPGILPPPGRAALTEHVSRDEICCLDSTFHWFFSI